MASRLMSLCPFPKEKYGPCLVPKVAEKDWGILQGDIKRDAEAAATRRQERIRHGQGWAFDLIRRWPLRR